MFFFEDKILISCRKLKKKTYSFKKKIKKQETFFEKRQKSLTFGNFFSPKTRQTNEIFRIFFEKPRVKIKIFYLSGNNFNFVYYFKSFHFIENFRIICEMLFLTHDQFFFHHKNENSLSEYVSEIFSNLKFNSFGWLMEYKDFLPRFLDKNHDQEKQIYSNFFKKKNNVLAGLNLFIQLKKFFFKKIQKCFLKNSLALRNLIGKISIENLSFFFEKLSEITNLIRYKKNFFKILFEKTKYDFSRLFTYKKILVIFLEFQPKISQELKKICENYLRDLELREIKKIKTKENNFWIETYIDICERKSKNLNTRFFFLSKRKKELFSQIIFILLINSEYILQKKITWFFFTNYLVFFFENQNFFPTWALELLFKLFQEFNRKEGNLTSFMKLLRNKLYNLLRNLNNARVLFFLKEIYLSLK